MSQGYFNYQELDPRLFGYPQNQASLQPTQLFWQQYPRWTQPSQQVYNYQHHYPTHNIKPMESQTIFIGSNTKNGRILPPESMTVRNNRFTPRPKVDVYVNGIFVRQMPLGTLVRFSKTAAAAFPKLDTTTKDKDKSAEVETSPACADRGNDNVDVEELTAEVAKLGTGAQTPTAPNVVLQTQTNSSAQPLVKQLDLYLGTLWYQPTPQSIKFALQWMEEARTARHGEAVLIYGVPQPEALSLQNLVDTYAAALCLDLRPFPHKHRHDIMTRMTDVRPMLPDVHYIHEHLPVDDPVMTRLITSFFQHKAKHSYAHGEAEAIEDYVYVANDDQLFKRFEDIQKDRDEKAKLRTRRRGAAKMQSIAQELDGNMQEEHGQTTATAATPITAAGPSTTEPNPTEAEKEGGGRRRNRRKQQQKGRGVSGRDIPEAKY